MFPPAKRTKIVCTIGPASEMVPKLERMIRAGMNVARLNFSHGTYPNHHLLIRNIRIAAKRVGATVALLADLQGPKVRVGFLPNDGVSLKTGKTVTFRAGTDTMSGGVIPIPYLGLAHDLARGDRMLLRDGQIEVKVIGIRDRNIHGEIIVGGILTSHQGISVPTATLRVPAVTDKDLRDLKFALSEDVDFVALSFVRRARDLEGVRRLLKRSKQNREVKLIAKIEKHEAVKHFGEILEKADGIMIARGDLGVEMPAERVPVLQKQIIGECLAAAKPVIVATEMLDSMIRNPRPTRAEVSDVANAVVDHADAVMLSGETATGKYPVGAVETMARVIRETERSPYDDLAIEEIRDRCRSYDESLAEVARLAACTPGTRAIVVTTETGNTARLVARFRPELPIVALTTEARIGRQLALSWGLVPALVRPAKTAEALLRTAKKVVRDLRLVRRGERVLLVTGEQVGKSGQINFVKFIEF